MSEPAQEKWFIGLVGYIYEAHFECHDILMLGKSPRKWQQRPDMTLAVDWDVKHQFKQTNKAKKGFKVVNRQQLMTNE